MLFWFFPMFFHSWFICIYICTYAINWLLSGKNEWCPNGFEVVAKCLMHGFEMVSLWFQKMAINLNRSPGGACPSIPQRLQRLQRLQRGCHDRRRDLSNGFPAFAPAGLYPRGSAISTREYQWVCRQVPWGGRLDQNWTKIIPNNPGCLK